ncbi:MAG: patatin-like phospholipase family protein, partial [Rhizobium pusense]|nr:patatin-like phospholipase family protein [Agrobacterium pusense]
MDQAGNESVTIVRAGEEVLEGDGAGNHEPTFGLALGGGGARGICHINVIEAFDELGIRPVAISGSSIGSIIGAGMAAGMSGREIREYTLELMGRKGSVANRLWSLGPASM